MSRARTSARPARTPLRSARSACIVLSTIGSPTHARRLARRLVQERAAACVNIVPRIESVYRWKGRVEQAVESLLILKTTQARLAGLCRRIKLLHPYEVPEILALPLSHGDPAYLQWLEESLMISV
ncbi:MAG: divalent-cation tolerance protein CutA [Candidatus Omnitrophica bacterium]|nr:divalent-cation tolerance protein CutA [Candidatus Omnitrophota bacterium]